MEAKKSQAANTERLRWPLTLMGALFVSGLVLASFTYQQPFIENDLAEVTSSGDNSQVQQEEKQEEKPEQQEETTVEATPPPQEEIAEIENKEEEPKPDVKIPPPTKVDVKEKPAPQAEVIDFPDVEAQFPGGAVELQRWINNHVQYPETSIEMEEQGKVYLSFVVEMDGSISGINVEKGVSKDLDREAKRVVSSMPNWIPGEAGGKKARTRCRLPIVFTLK